MNSNCSKCQQTNPPSVSSNSFQIDISEIKIDMCESENIIGPKGKTSESDNIDVVIHDTSENLSVNKRESSDSDIEIAILPYLFSAISKISNFWLSALELLDDLGNHVFGFWLACPNNVIDVCTNHNLDIAGFICIRIQGFEYAVLCEICAHKFAA